MKLLWIVADAARLPEFRRALAEFGAPGYTALPVMEGAGRTGLHAADRVHPGALTSLVVVAEDDEAGRLFDRVRAWRDERDDSVTRLFLLPVERQA